MSILRKPLAEVALADLDALIANGTRESGELELKGSLPFQRVKGQNATQDRWMIQGDRIGDYARDKIITELVAFANADGGTLIVGIQENTEGRASALAPLPRCEDLRKRLADACEDVIEPRLPILETRALPADQQGAGYVLMRVARSGAGPHRLVSDGQFYMRRRDRSERMTVREIRDAVLDLARRGDTVAELFAKRQRDDHTAMSAASRNTSDMSAARVLCLSVRAIPTTRLSIPNLTERLNLWWKDGEHVVKVNGGSEEGRLPSLGIPATAADRASSSEVPGR